MRVTLLVALVAAMAVLSGCATITGTVTGAFTGAGDLQAQTYYSNQQTFIEHPMLFGVNFIVVGPIGIVTGPFFGLAKGAALDVQWCHDMVDYHDVFSTLSETSIWRPHTWDWPTKTIEEDALAVQPMGTGEVD